jgi:hypothetical protein
MEEARQRAISLSLLGLFGSGEGGGRSARAGRWLMMEGERKECCGRE